jgi:membrane-associated HD superfamily phosphohydrolase
VDETVTGIIDRVYLDGQLNECDLTLRDLHAVGRAISQVLAAVSHARVDYPGQGTHLPAAGGHSFPAVGGDTFPSPRD